MNKFWLYTVVIALIMTAIVERCYQPEPFDPITEHSQIKAYYRPVVRLKIKWENCCGDEHAHVVPYYDSVLVEEYN